MPSSEANVQDTANAEPSVSSSLEHLVAGSQGVITKRIDLALLEARELLSRTFQGVALVGMAIILATAAWFAATTSTVLWVLPEAPWVTRLAAFALLNATTAIALLMVAGRRGRPAVDTSARARPTVAGEN